MKERREAMLEEDLDQQPEVKEEALFADGTKVKVSRPFNPRNEVSPYCFTRLTAQWNQLCNYIRRNMPHAAWLVIVPAIKRAHQLGLFQEWMIRKTW